MSAFQWGLVQSMFTVGGLCGALIGGPLSTRHGRLFAMRFIITFAFIGPVLESLAPKLPVLILGRYVSGIGAGAALVISPIYISEISPATKRGLFGAVTQVMINSGILIAQLLGYFLSHDNLWRIILFTSALIALIQFFGLLAAPETPKWLAENNRPALGHKILQRIRGSRYDVHPEAREWDWSSSPAFTGGESEQEPLLAPPPQPRRQSASPKLPNATFLSALRNPQTRRAILAVTSTFAAQQLCGINSVVMYSVTILDPVFPSGSGAALITILVSLVNVLVTALCAPLADLIGRKPCLLLSIAGMGLNSALLSIGLSHDIPVLSTTAMLLFVCSFAIGLGPVPFILASELVGPEAVGATSSWALAGNWASTFLVAQFFPMLNKLLPNGQVFWVFVGIAAFFGCTVALAVPESRGRGAPEEIWRRFDGETVCADGRR